MRRYLASRLPPDGQRATLSAEVSHHLLVVCRHPRGGELLLYDGAGHEVEAALVDVDGEGRAVVEGRGPVRDSPDEPLLHLVLGLPKGPALEHALRMAVEIGATHVHPALSARSVPRTARTDRWARVVRAACQQCGRAVQPTVSPLRPLHDVVAGLPPELDRWIGVVGAPSATPTTGALDRALAIGPEGGFTPAEIDHARSCGWLPVGLGTWTLRVDTAVAVGLARLR